MSLVNPETKEIICKIVYYGPSLGGKTTNVQRIFHETSEEQDGKLEALNAETERTLFYDFLPLDVGEIRGYRVRFHVFSVPGQVVYDASRKLIMKMLDGIIFVADSQKERMEENINSLRNLEVNLKQQGLDITEIPLVIQYNKRDLPNAMSIDEMRKELNKYNAPEFEATAQDGKGVFESLNSLSKSIITVLKGGKI
ncbi:MAG: gliding-motility protein MglA [Bdellovibrionaceae bacterium]|mgnify:CR=1 FL=1|nr:gliding-motility protein MglA [Pseudobdellovibrionaceae bacterium]MEC9282841.1 ADP-ribosylation factor-like protein [Bdellovibrionota bacterium]|tara:strand:+ start:23932 stop:24522 length:591 start_codon:yes stop_codon:yes gene_type:complete